MPDRIEQYRRAGELFGRLRTALGFGGLSMETSGQGKTYVYTWSFLASGKRYAGHRTVSREELASLASIEQFADLTAAEFKDQYRTLKDG